MKTTFPNDAACHGAVWVDLYNPTEEELGAARAEHDVPIPSRQKLEEIETSSRLRVDAGALVMSMPIASKSGTGDEMPTPFGFVLTPKVLVTVRYADLQTIRMTVESLSKIEAIQSVDIFATLLEAMVDHSADMLEEIGAELNAASQGVFKRYRQTNESHTVRANQALREILARVGDAGDRLGHIRESILGLQRISPFVLDKGQPWIAESARSRLKTIGEDLKSLADYLINLTDKVQFLLDAVLGFISTEQNDIFKVLTIVSVIGIPPTLVAGMYGMNFDTIHEYHWHYGYAWGLALIFLSGVVPAAWFKWRGWW